MCFPHANVQQKNHQYLSTRLFTAHTITVLFSWVCEQCFASSRFAHCRISTARKANVVNETRPYAIIFNYPAAVCYHCCYC